jgi:hypothetical protein
MSAFDPDLCRRRAGACWSLELELLLLLLLPLSALLMVAAELAELSLLLPLSDSGLLLLLLESRTLRTSRISKQYRHIVLRAK